MSTPAGEGAEEFAFLAQASPLRHVLSVIHALPAEELPEEFACRPFACAQPWLLCVIGNPGHFQPDPWRDSPIRLHRIVAGARHSATNGCRSGARHLASCARGARCAS